MAKELRITRQEFLRLTGAGLLTFLAACARVPDNTPQPESTSKPPEPTPMPTEMADVFEKEPSLSIDFTTMKDGTPIDPKLFTMEKGHFNNTEEVNTDLPENVRIEGGSLVIQALKKDNGHTSARLSMKEKEDFGEGTRVEVTAWFPSGIGPFAAIWYQNTDQLNSKNPALVDLSDKKKWSANGEIDGTEVISADASTLYSTLHTFDSVHKGGNPNGKRVKLPEGIDVTTGFHTFTMDWVHDYIAFAVDGLEYARIPRISEDPHAWPFTGEDRKYHLMLNLAMGGEWAKQIADQQGYNTENGIDDSTAADWIFRIQSINFYKQKA